MIHGANRRRVDTAALLAAQVGAPSRVAVIFAPTAPSPGTATRAALLAAAAPIPVDRPVAD
jgi:hypothetical protein